MYQAKFCVITLLLFSGILWSQNEQDTTKTVNLNEVIIVNKPALNKQKNVKPLGSLDEYLDGADKVSMIKRGNYAWEPSINNMVSERISVTIDGMQIFGACTDKMDPITSYVDVSNLSEVHVKSGQQGAENGTTIGGGIDLKLKKGNFENEVFTVGVDAGYGGNGNARIVSAEMAFSNLKSFVNADAIYRKSENYYAGGNVEVLNSQYEKYNISTVFGFKSGKKGAFIGSFIFDKATNVGYPALTMDVSLAKAIIGSVSYIYQLKNPAINNWETKLYANSITHVMDDTTRPDAPIHMDMPGWSDTYGFFSKMNVEKDKHAMLFNFNGYYNKSLAEMTMYPANPNENLMFMLTWPDVRTLYTGVYGEDSYNINHHSNFNFSARFGFQNETIESEFGYNSLKIFYPDMSDTQSRFIFNLASQYTHHVQKFQFLAGIGYGERAPSVTESYGFYLYNSFDNYDYIGNPYLTNEQSFELDGGVEFSTKKLKLGVDASYFHIKNYIIGEIDPDIDRMTIGAEGVKVYEALKYATIFDAGFNANYAISKLFSVNGNVNYNLGIDNNGNNLPLISPVDYSFQMYFNKSHFNASFGLTGNGEQRNYSPTYGEDATQAYTLFDASASYNFYKGNNSLFVKLGIDNIFDRYYSSYSNWNNIPSMGRNCYINMILTIN